MEEAGAEKFEKYFRFLNEFEWIFNFKVTNFFIERIWEKAPAEWLDFFEHHMTPGILKDLPSGSEIIVNNVDNPHSLRLFLRASQELTVLKETQNSILGPKIDLSNDERRHLTVKKQHEIGYFAPVIVDVCRKKKIQTIIDIGCGLGHLAKVLSARIPFCKIVGLDSDFKLCTKADSYVYYEADNQAQETTVSNNTSSIGRNVHFRNFSLSNSAESIESLKKLLNTLTGPSLFICLHGCGDLQPAIMRILTKIAAPKSNLVGLLTIGCCYHKMDLSIDNPGFPLSKSAINTQQEFGSKNFCVLSKFALRLAAQETIARWRIQTTEDHLNHENNVAFRGVLELAENQGFHFAKAKRHLIKKDATSNFQNFIESIFRRTDHDIKLEKEARDCLEALYGEYEQHFKLVEPITALQVSVQGVLESLILIDRFTFLREKGFDVKIEPVFDAEISPRNMLISAFIKQPYDENFL